MNKSILLVVLAVMVVVGVAYALTPPMFVQAGNHYFTMLNLFSVSDVYRCEQSDTDECVVMRESAVTAFTHDPWPQNWLPVQVEAI